MKKDLPMPVVIAVLVIVILVVIGVYWGISSMQNRPSKGGGVPPQPGMPGPNGQMMPGMPMPQGPNGQVPMQQAPQMPPQGN